MKNSLFLIFLIYTAHCNAQFHYKLDFTRFSASIYPKKCVDTLNFTIEKGEFINCNAKIFLEDCRGQSKVIITDNKKITRVTGYYANAMDTLAKYSNAKVMGKPMGHSYYQVRVLKYLSPLETGVWIFYDRNGNTLYRTEFHFERYNSGNPEVN